MAQFRQSGTDRLFARSQIDATTVGDRIGIRSIQKFGRNRRVKPPHQLSAASVAIGLTLLAAFYLSFVAFRRLSGFKETKSGFDEYSANNKSDSRRRVERSLAFKELRFGHFSDGSGRDSRYWDRDDRRRDNDYSEDEAISRNSRSDSARKELPKERMFESGRSEIGRGGLYNEGGRKELDSYRRKYEDSLKNDGQARGDDKVELANTFDEYDDGVDEEVEHEDLVEKEGENGNQFDDGELASADDSDDIRKWSDAGAVKKGILTNSNVKASIKVSSKISGQSQMVGADADGSAGKESSSDFGKKAGLKRKSKRQKASRPFCEMRFLDSTALLVEPLENKKFARFSLQYTEIEEKPGRMVDWVPRFAGRQSSQEREQSYYAHDQKINCGFINGPPGSRNTGFDLVEDDTKYMSSCHIAVSSCIFGNSDHLRTPFLKKISRQSRKNVCFIMFVDEITLQTLLSEGQKMDSAGFIGLWKIVVVQNLPYSDMRRVGKIPKLLTHRLFPSARYSIWLDSKLRLQSDPYLILEYFLWRKGYEYAISNHYDRHCVWEEVAQNKRLNKYNHTVIDEQFAFYQSDGLTRFDPSDPNKLLPSYVPEGSFIVRAHTPMSNLFSCLWFNEVDHWTPRDQLSFAYTYLKLRRKNPEKHFHLNMFKDCERRSIAKLFHHRDEDSRIIPAL